MFVFDTGRTPYPVALLAEFPLDGVTMSEVTSGRFGAEHFTLSLPGEGTVPFVAGRRAELAALRAAVTRSADPGP